MAKKTTFTGYVPCACRDCMEIAIGKLGKALCCDCADAGCEPNDGECKRDDGYSEGWDNPEVTRSEAPVSMAALVGEVR